MKARADSPSGQGGRPQRKTLGPRSRSPSGSPSAGRKTAAPPGDISPLSKLAALSPFSQRRVARKAVAASDSGSSSANVYIMLAAVVTCAALAPPRAWEDAPFRVGAPVEELPTSSLLRTHLNTLPNPFDRLDSDRNGLVDASEIGTSTDTSEVLTNRLQDEHEVADVLAEIDTDGDKHLSEHELADWLRLCPADDRVASHHFCVQCLCSLLVGLGMGGLAGSSTLGVAVFALASPQGYLCQYNAVVPIVCACCSATVVGVYLEHASWAKCFQMC